MTESGHFHWNELMTRDVAASKAFYGATLGWTFETMPMADGSSYVVAMAGGRPAAGIFDVNAMPAEHAPEAWFAYVSVADLDGALARARANGGRVEREPFDVEGVGRIAIVTDPRGVTMGWMTPTA